MLSIILPIRNAQPYLIKCLDSVKNQTYKSWKLYIVDDASTDDSYLIARNYLSINLSSKKFLLRKNKVQKGITKSLNYLINISNSKYIARVDADDVNHPLRFEEQMKIIKSDKNLDVVGTAAFIIDNNDNVIKTQIMPETDHLIKKYLFKKNCFFHSSVIIKRDFLLKNNLYNENYINGQDYDLWLRGSKNSFYYNLKKPLIYYRRNYKNFSIIKLKCYFLIRFKNIRKKKNFLILFYILTLNLFIEIYKYLKGKFN
jgi:glycosyltransferase involved in cell wall biosynthesis